MFKNIYIIIVKEHYIYRAKIILFVIKFCRKTDHRLLTINWQVTIIIIIISLQPIFHASIVRISINLFLLNFETRANNPTEPSSLLKNRKKLNTDSHRCACKMIVVQSWEIRSWILAIMLPPIISNINSSDILTLYTSPGNSNGRNVVATRTLSRGRYAEIGVKR